MEKQRGRILVIRGGALGDFILTCPALAALRLTFPETRIEVLAYPSFAILAQSAGLVDGIRSIEARPLAGFFAKDGPLDVDLSDYFATFSIIISYLYDPDGVFKANIARSSKAQFIQGPHRPDETSHLPAAEILLKPLERLAIYGADPTCRFRFEVSEEFIQQNAQPFATPAPIVACHPGSGSDKKNWPGPLWNELLRKITSQTNWNIVVVAGEVERDRLPGVMNDLPAERYRLAESLPLVTIGRLLSQSTVFVGHDSGISHLAAAMGVPAILLWGGTNWKIWRPLGDHVQFIKPPDGLDSLRVEEVFATLKSAID